MCLSRGVCVFQDLQTFRTPGVLAVSGVGRKVWCGVSGDVHAVWTTTCATSATTTTDTAYGIRSLEYHAAISQGLGE